MRVRYWTLTMAVVLGISATAYAQPAGPQAPPADVHAQAEEQFHQARVAMNEQRYAQALDLLRASQAVEFGRGKLLNIAVCEEALGQLTLALGHYEMVAAQLPDTDERTSVVASKIAALRPRIPTLQILVNGAAPGMAPFPSPEPGPAFPTAARFANPSPPPSVPAAVPAAGSPFDGVWVPGILGLGALGTGTVFGILAITKQNESKASCDPFAGTTYCDSVGADLRSSSRYFATLSTITVITGASAVGIAVWKYVDASRARSKAAGVAASLAVGPGAVQVVGSW